MINYVLYQGQKVQGRISIQNQTTEFAISNRVKWKKRDHPTNSVKWFDKFHQLLSQKILSAN